MERQETDVPRDFNLRSGRGRIAEFIREERHDGPVQQMDIDPIITAYEIGRRAAGDINRQGGNHDNAEEEFRQLFDSYARLGPPKFDGNSSYSLAEEWLAAVKSRLNICRATPEYQVELVTYYLEDTARHWWEGMKRTYNGDALRIPWDWFEEQFERRFLSTMQKEALRQ